MYLNLGKAAVAASAMALLPLAAGAAILSPGTINFLSPGMSYTGGSPLGGGSSLLYSFKVTAPLSIGGFSLSGTGNNAGADIGAVRVTTPGGTNTLANLDNDGVITTADGKSGAVDATVDGPFDFDTGDEFDVVFANNSGGDVSVTVSFETEEGMTPPAAVPLPAAGGLLALGLLGMGAARRRKN